MLVKQWKLFWHHFPLFVHTAILKEQDALFVDPSKNYKFWASVFFLKMIKASALADMPF